MESRGIPKNISDLNEHRMVVYGESLNLPYEDVNWLLDLLQKNNAGQNQKIVRVNNVYGIFRAVQGGVGIVGASGLFSGGRPKPSAYITRYRGAADTSFLFIQRNLEILKE